jgi:hypothetical protein
MSESAPPQPIFLHCGRRVLRTRSLSLLAALLVCVFAGACGDQDDPGADEGNARPETATREQKAESAAQRAARRLPSAFRRFARTLPGAAGATVGAPGLTPAAPLGRLRSGSAWSTIKVPIALRVLEERGGPSGLTPSERGAIERALVASDNSAAAELFGSLGDTATAAAAVDEVLREANDVSTHVSTVGRGSFSPYGQTDWALKNQHRFMAALAGGCIGEPRSRRYLLELMGRVTSDSWGLGSVGLPSRWKSGWGPGTDGDYLVRQMGVVEIRGRRLVVTLAALPSDGSFTSAQNMATEVARWLVEHGAPLAGSANSRTTDCSPVS